MPENGYQPGVYRKHGGNELTVQSGGVVRIEAGGQLIDEQAQGSSVGALLFNFDFVLTDDTAGAQTKSIVIKDTIEIIDVSALKTGGGSSGATALTAQLQTSSGGAISNALDIKQVDKTIVRAGTLDDALVSVAAGSTLNVVRAGSGSTVAGNNAAVVRVTAVKRSA